MKKWIMGSLAILLGVMSISIPFAGIHTAEAKTTEETDKKLNIVTTIFPEYDWTRVILGDRADDVNLTMLLDNGTDLHSFQPAVKDIMKVSSCDLLIYVGGESDQWIEDALESAQNKDMKTINLMEVLGDSIKEEETVEGMQESDHDHDHDHVFTIFLVSTTSVRLFCSSILQMPRVTPPLSDSVFFSTKPAIQDLPPFTRYSWTARKPSLP